jgi:UDP-N-acetylmuramoyl-tripeptide--D-alanyl-D-alanine ligase
MPRLTAAEVESGTRGNLAYGPADTVFSNVSIDTRNLQGGEVFFAIRGPNQDGHRFIPDALSKGALGAVAERGYEYPGEFPAGRTLIRVESTHEALKDLAISVRRRWSGTLVGITGIMGKTTTREFVAHILKSRFRVYRTPGNYNNLFGLPLALFGLDAGQDFGIFEMGMSAPGEIAEMCRIASPGIGIITNVAPVHLEFFNSLEGIARAKGELAEALTKDGALIYNADDQLVREIAGRFAGRRISFGLSGSADVHAKEIEIAGLDETRFRLSCGGESVSASIPLPGAHFVMNALPAVAIGSLFNIPLGTMVASFGTLQQASMRGQILHFRQGCTVIDDSYNSNPRALMKMIEVLSGTPAFTRRILVAGEMLELGSGGDSLHFECGVFAANRGVDVVIGIRGAAREIVRGAVESGLTASQAHFFQDADSAADFVKTEIRGGDLVLIKGSRGVHLEKIVQKLRATFEIVAGSHR